jgi:hypothetical protein
VYTISRTTAELVSGLEGSTPLCSLTALACIGRKTEEHLRRTSILPRETIWRDGIRNLLDHIWIQGVVEDGDGIDLGGNGYPFRLTVKAKHMLPILEETPPRYIEKAVVASCRPEEWLLIEVWEQS